MKTLSPCVTWPVVPTETSADLCLAGFQRICFDFETGRLDFLPVLGSLYFASICQAKLVSNSNDITDYTY